MQFKLEDLGRLIEGTLFQRNGAWFVRSEDGKEQAIHDLLQPFAEKSVRVTVADLSILRQAETEFRSLAQNVTGLSNAELAAKLKRNLN